MRVYKPTKKYRKWYFELRDHQGKVRRFAGLMDKRKTEQLGQQVQRLIDCRFAGEQPDARLTKWLEVAPSGLRKHLVGIGLLSTTRAAAGNLLTEHLNDFRLSMVENSAKYVRQIVNALERTFTDCGFEYWSDIEPVKLEIYLKDKFLPESQRNFNSYLKAVKQFCRWMVKNGRASESPIVHLQTITVTQPKRRRRALELNELLKLLETTEAGPVRFGMIGRERAMLYRVAAETGLRANELRSLRTSSFDLKNQVVTVEAAYSKRKRKDTLPLKQETATELESFFAGKMPTAKAFKVPEKTSDMLQEDLADAGIPYIDDAGRVFDFHALRHQTGTLLKEGGVHPKDAQVRMRHSDINLTMKIYTHTLRGAEAAAIAKMPSLSTQKKQRKIYGA